MKQDNPQSTKKIYRPNVAAVLLSPAYPEKCEYFIAERRDIKNAWQFPQGGIDEDETPIQSLLRELYEEVGTNDVEVIVECPFWETYDFPKHVSKKFYPFCGQRQKFFLVRLKPEAKINLLATEKPEFIRYKFVSYDVLFKHIRHFKRPIYKKVLSYFLDNGFLHRENTSSMGRVLYKSLNEDKLLNTQNGKN